VCQILLANMLVTWHTCPLNIPNDNHRRGSALIVRRCKRSKSGAGFGQHAPLVFAGDANGRSATGFSVARSELGTEIKKAASHCGKAA
jgi:hypothetical protein